MYLCLFQNYTTLFQLSLDKYDIFQYYIQNIDD